ncbi:hypothetical protein NDU88_003274 [Pleurodeles waltl]|uniref:Uncharacterized protein n=1 Tax=Pleurodeles waltl TaxID=8319 RepID=A0AAV7V049_PLEWA|nr:hypothetical protein NDU88_003274 [Pleurodeles waltl]
MFLQGSGWSRRPPITGAAGIYAPHKGRKDTGSDPLGTQEPPGAAPGNRRRWRRPEIGTPEQGECCAWLPWRWRTFGHRWGPLEHTCALKDQRPERGPYIKTEGEESCERRRNLGRGAYRPQTEVSKGAPDSRGTPAGLERQAGTGGRPEAEDEGGDQLETDENAERRAWYNLSGARKGGTV